MTDDEQTPEQMRKTFIRIISENGTLNDAAEAVGRDRTTLLRWLREDESGELRNQYARAREDQGDLSADEVKLIARKVLDGDYDPSAARVAIDALKWDAGKRKPKVYGDKLELNGDPANPLQVAGKMVLEFVKPGGNDAS